MSTASVIILDYGSGNLRSVAKAFERVAESASIRVSNDPAELTSASHIVLPGVGAYADCMRGLRAVPGLLDALEDEVRNKKKWFLGICVGLQMLLERGHEHGVHAGLEWIRGEVVPLAVTSDEKRVMREAPPVAHRSSLVTLKIPHMGWNELTIHTPHTLLSNIQNGAHAYFVHSYHAVCADKADILAVTEYGGEVTAIVGRDNIFGTQFHPEKSQETGLRLLRNFLSL